MGEYEQMPGDGHDNYEQLPAGRPGGIGTPPAGGQRRFVSTGQKKSGAGLFFLGLAAGVIAAAVGVGVFMGLRGGGIGTLTGGGTGSSSGGSVINEASKEKLDTLQDTIEDAYYWSDDVTKEQLENGMYKGLVDSLGDPYSVYYTPEELKDLTQQTQGVYYGIGAYVSSDPEAGYAVISGVIKNSPAEAAKLQEGDIIYKVDDEDMSGLDLETVVSKIRGEEGTSVHLTLIRGSDTVEKDIVRARVDSPTVDSKMLEDGIGYLQITEFDDITVGQFDENLQSLKDQGMKAMILDLRGNPGGNVSTVTEIAERLLPKGMIFYMEEKNGKRTEYTCQGADWDLPLVVLVNQYSASASEILAGAIQDAGIGKLVGKTTFGKGIVQTILSLGDGSAVKLTIANYYTRNGRDIHKKGIEPDVDVDLDSDAYIEDGTDTQLNKGLEVIKELMK